MLFKLKKKKPFQQKIKIINIFLGYQGLRAKTKFSIYIKSTYIILNLINVYIIVGYRWGENNYFVENPYMFVSSILIV